MLSSRRLRTFDFDDGSFQTCREELRMDDNENPKAMGEVIQIDEA